MSFHTHKMLRKSLGTQRWIHLAHMGFFGFSSALSSYFLFATLGLWLADHGVSLVTMGILSWTSFPYPCKIFFSPWVETLQLGSLTLWLGQRRSWMLLTQGGLVLSFFCLSFLHPQHHPWWVGGICIFLALCGSLQDSVLAAYRIETTPPSQQSSAAGASTFGYRIGTWAMGYCFVLLAHYCGWPMAFRSMALGLLLGIGVIFTLPSFTQASHPKGSVLFFSSFLLWKESCTFFKTHFHLSRIIIVMISYKLGDVWIRSMESPFFLSLGYSKENIAQGRALEIIAILFGVSLGSFFLSKRGVNQGIRVWSLAQCATSLLFAWHGFVGKNDWIFLTTLMLNSSISGLGGTVNGTYLTCLCQNIPQGIAVHYALLASFSSLLRIIVTFVASLVAYWVSWPVFFLLGGVCCLPAFFLSFTQKAFRQKGYEGK